MNSLPALPFVVPAPADIPGAIQVPLPGIPGFDELLAALVPPLPEAGPTVSVAAIARMMVQELEDQPQRAFSEPVSAEHAERPSPDDQVALTTPSPAPPVAEPRPVLPEQVPPATSDQRLTVHVQTGLRQQNELVPEVSGPSGKQGEATRVIQVQLLDQGSEPAGPLDLELIVDHAATRLTNRAPLPQAISRHESLGGTLISSRHTAVPVAETVTLAELEAAAATQPMQPPSQAQLLSAAARPKRSQRRISQETARPVRPARRLAEQQPPQQVTKPQQPTLRPLFGDLQLQQGPEPIRDPLADATVEMRTTESTPALTSSSRPVPVPSTTNAVTHAEVAPAAESAVLDFAAAAKQADVPEPVRFVLESWQEGQPVRSIRIALEPKELGGLRIVLHQRSGNQVHARVIVDRAAAIPTVRTQMHSLQAALVSRGIEFSSYSVTLATAASAAGIMVDEAVQPQLSSRRTSAARDSRVAERSPFSETRQA